MKKKIDLCDEYAQEESKILPVNATNKNFFSANLCPVVHKRVDSILSNCAHAGIVVHGVDIVSFSGFGGSQLHYYLISTLRAKYSILQKLIIPSMFTVHIF